MTPKLEREIPVHLLKDALCHVLLRHDLGSVVKMIRLVPIKECFG